MRELGDSALRPAAMDYVTTVTLVFAHQTCVAVRAGTWPVAEIGWVVEEGLRRVAVHAYRDLDVWRQWSSWESFYESAQTQIRKSDGWLAHLDEAASASGGAENVDRIEEQPDESEDRRSHVDAFLEECNRAGELPVKIIRKHLWLAVGHKTRRQFQYWQSANEKATQTDDRNFERVLSMSPQAFVSTLKKKNLL